jgi:hypothetical protein
MVLTTGVVRGVDEAAAALEGAGAFALLRGGAADWPWLEAGAGGGVELAGGASVESSGGCDDWAGGAEDGGGALDAGGRAEDCGGRAEDAGGGADEAGGGTEVSDAPPPVPVACLFSPLCMYSATPSNPDMPDDEMLVEAEVAMNIAPPRLKPEDKVKRLETASSHEMRSMVCGVEAVKAEGAGEGRGAGDASHEQCTG